MTSASLALPRGRQPARGLAAGLLVFIWLLPFHILVMAFLFGGLGLPTIVVRLIAAWKETLVGVLVATVMLRAALGRGNRSTVQWLDLAVGGLVLLALPYLLGAGIWFGLDVPIGARLYGLRDAVYFSLLYFVGRATPEVVRDERVLKALFLVGVITSVVAVLERLFVTPEMLVLLGAAAYVQDFLGVAVFTAGNPYGLPSNYWVPIGNTLVWRAGSTYLSSQGFAIPFLIIVPAATAWLFAKKRTSIAWLGYGVLWLGLLLSVTRMTIVACLLQVLIIAAVRRRWGLITTTGIACAIGFGCALFLLPGFATYIWETLTWQNSSSASHVDSWIDGLENALRYPFGAGLGTAEQTAWRFGLVPLAGDNQYLRYAVELGVLGLGLHLATLVGAVLIGVQHVREGDDLRSAYGFVVAAAAVGILFNAVTAGVFNSTLLTCVFFWLLGSLATPVAVRGRV